jgi:hypothetical protein
MFVLRRFDTLGVSGVSSVAQASRNERSSDEAESDETQGSGKVSARAGWIDLPPAAERRRDARHDSKHGSRMERAYVDDASRGDPGGRHARLSDGWLDGLPGLAGGARQSR